MLEKLIFMAIGSLGGLIYQYHIYKDLSDKSDKILDNIIIESIENPTSFGEQP